MRVLVLNTSPKRKGGASRFFSRALSWMLIGNQITTASICNQADYANALSLLADADAVVISTPLYVDAIPAHMVEFLGMAETVCRERGYQFKVYVLSNSGFIEGCQNKIHMKMYEAWCRRAGVEFGGGVGIGGGVMLYAMFFLLPLSILLHGIEIMGTILTKGLITGGDIWEHSINLLVTLIIFLPMLVCLALLAAAVRKGRARRTLYTRAMVPSFVFLPFADLFMLISAVLKGTLPHKLFHRIAEEEKSADTGNDLQ